MAPDSSPVERIIDKNDRILGKLEDAAIKRLEAILQQSYDRLEQELLRSYANHSGNKSLLPNQRKLLILNEVRNLLGLVNPANQQAIDRVFQELLSQSYANGVNLAQQLAEAIANEQLQSFSGIPLQAVILQAQESRQRLSRHSDQFASKVSAIVEMGLVQGIGVRKIARQMRQELGITKGRSEAIVRTESLSSLNQAAQQTYKENGIEYIQSIATSDSRTCGLCVSRNMRVYKLGTIAIPYHVSCRCYLMPWKKEWSKLGLTNDDWAVTFDEQVRAELAAAGRRVDNGLSPFEKSAGVEKPPESVWKPGDAAATTSKPRYDRLPDNHVVSTNPRYSPQTFDEALDQIQSPGAADRVALFREFVGKNNIQVVLYDYAAPEGAQLRLFRDAIEFQNEDGSKWSEAELREATTFDGLEDAFGFTAGKFKHITVAVDGKRTVFAIEGEELQQTIDAVFAGADEGSGQAFQFALNSPTDRQNTSEFITYLHEMGHQVHGKLDYPRYPDDVEGCLTEYSMQNDFEWFAEHFAAWMIDAEGYAKLDPVGAKFIEDTLKRAIEAQP